MKYLAIFTLLFSVYAHGMGFLTTVFEEIDKKVETPQISLYWENTTEPHPERKPWTEALIRELSLNKQALEKATDVKAICPKYFTLSSEKQLKALGELFVATTYHESAFKPSVLYRECNKTKCQYSSGCQYHGEYGYCMKGGHKLDGGIVISRGLMQLSLESAKGYGCQVSTPDELHNPEKNLTCGVKIMVKQVDRTGLFLASSNYWAVLKPTSSWNKIEDIKKRVLKYAPDCK